VTLDKREKMNSSNGKFNVSDEILLIHVSSSPDTPDFLKNTHAWRQKRMLKYN